MELLHQPEDIVAVQRGTAQERRYRIIDILGQGGIGTTYEAEDLQTQQRVAIKVLSLRRMADWKVLELFEREARILSHLNHPGIPRYIDYFQIETPKNQSFYLVQELAEGRSLFSLVESGWHTTESEVKDIASQILSILTYLHRFTPPVIHRDIKPQNIIRRDDGHIFLVDFGSVKASYQSTMVAGNTVVGTYGYMAPEQFRGQAFPATDLYNLGATLVFLLTHRSPIEFHHTQLKTDLATHLQISPDFTDWLEKVLQPTVEDRFLSAKQALSVLKGEGVLVPKHRRPAGSRINLTKTAKHFVAEIPPKGWEYWDVAEFLFALIWFVAPFFVLSLIGAEFTRSISLFFALYSMLVWMIGAIKLKDALFKLWGRSRLEISRKHFWLRWSLLGVFYQVQGRTKDIDRLELISYMRKMDEFLAGLRNQIPQPVTVFSLVEGIRTHSLIFSLTTQEKEWLAQELADFLKKPLSTE